MLFKYMTVPIIVPITRVINNPVMVNAPQISI